MRLEHTFLVPLPPEQAWPLLLDVERIAPCLPGTVVEGVEGDTVTGRVRVKVGPIQVSYRGTGRFTERDEQARRAVIEASGKEMRGAGTAAATVTTTLTEDGPGTRVSVVTELTVTGRPAQFGRGVLSEVADRLIARFADALAGQLAGEPGPQPGEGTEPAEPAEPAGETGPGEPPTRELPVLEAPPAVTGAPVSAAPPVAAPPVRTNPQPRPEPEPIDLLAAAGAPLARRLAPLAVGLLLLLLVVRRLRRS
jgi:carbon monoxide dehydrogenase subunit G